MQEPTDETTEILELQKPHIEWELVSDPQRLKKLVSNTFEEVVIQTLSVANGRAELAAANNPRFDATRKENAATAQEAVQRAIEQVRELQGRLSQRHNQIPIDKRYKDPAKEYIALRSDRKDLPNQQNPTNTTTVQTAVK